MILNKTIYSLLITTWFISCSGVDKQELAETTKMEINLSKNAQAIPVDTEQGMPKDGVIEVISPLQGVDGSRNFTLPNRDGSKDYEMQKLKRLADLMKERAPDPKTFEEKVSVFLTLDNVELGVVINEFSQVLSFQYLVDPGVKGFVKSSISLENSMTVYDAWKLFEQVLYINNAYASIDEAGIIRVFPLTKIAQDALASVPGQAQGNVNIVYYSLQNITAAEALPILKPFMSANASASVIPSSNALLIVETSANMDRLNTILQTMDANGQSNWPQIAYRCRFIDSAVLLAELQSAIPVLGFSLAAGENQGAGVKMASIDRMQIIVASAPSGAVLNEVYKWIQILDTAESEGATKVFYYPVRHGISADLVAALQLFFPNSANAASPQTNASNSTSSRASTNNTNNRTTPNRTTTNRNTTNSSDVTSIKSLFEEPVTIFEDSRRNQLVIRTKPKTYSMVKAILRHLDAPAMQVMIQVTAVEVELGEGLEFGFEYAATDKFGSGDNESGVGVGSSTADTPSFGPPGGLDPGISLLLQSAGVDNEFAFVQAVAGDSSSELLFTPHILTLNGEEAEINIGQNVPVRAGTTSTSSNNDFEQIEYRSTGVLLRVLPQVSADKYVTLDTEIVISSIVEQSPEEVLIDSPSFNENKVTTKLLIKNNETILLGGIIQKVASESTSGVPFLKDIPGIGFLFQSATTGSREKELVIFIKATVIEQKSDFQDVVNRYGNAMKFKNETPEVP
ncbi:secretion protein XqhA [Lentisphaera araneosa HTCC2155]|uniref:Secretion protein XqhA n=1 Tax=Lentisphaera araneosa HTCC2155 TaxID=313628 RepID=A6DJN7_9BACT|nr:secretin N-terminal domain-containing protein [Lentisphaera araneosa]EDM28111.1 secretion protein XqhA [Lentisphaera araneosa HTCC2155]